MNLINWTYVLDDSALPENHMMPSYPMGLNVLLARVGGVVGFGNVCTSGSASPKGAQ